MIICRYNTMNLINANQLSAHFLYFVNMTAQHTEQLREKTLDEGKSMLTKHFSHKAAPVYINTPYSQIRFNLTVPAYERTHYHCSVTFYKDHFQLPSLVRESSQNKSKVCITLLKIIIFIQYSNRIFV